MARFASVRTAAGSPAASTLPPASKTSRSQNRAASAKSCRTTTTPPPAPAFLRSKSMTCSWCSGIKGRDRFVCKQHRRFDCQRPRQQHAHALAAGDLVHRRSRAGGQYRQPPGRARWLPDRPPLISESGGDAAAGQARPAPRSASASGRPHPARGRRSAATAPPRPRPPHSCPSSAPRRCRRPASWRASAAASSCRSRSARSARQSRPHPRKKSTPLSAATVPRRTEIFLASIRITPRYANARSGQREMAHR